MDTTITEHFYYFWLISLFFFGAVIGSFLNVVILRLPEGESLSTPPSRCPKCGSPVRAYDNIPILSYIILLGKCRDCREGISIRYPLIEFLEAILAASLFAKFGLTAEFIVFFLFCSAMLVVFWIDLDHLIIPDVITLNGIPLGIIPALFGYIPDVNWKFSLMGTLLGGAILYFPAAIYQRIRGIEGLGGGDIKLLAMIGSFTGPYGVIFVLFFSSLFGSVVALAGMAFKKAASTTPIPFGPFLTAAAIAYVFYGSEMLTLFFSLSHH